MHPALFLATVMIVGFGIDLVANSRVERELAQDEWLSGRWHLHQPGNQPMQPESKTGTLLCRVLRSQGATLKALGVEVADLGMMREVEVELGDRCAIVLHDRMKSESEQLGVRHIRLSVAPSKRQTGAMVIGIVTRIVRRDRTGYGPAFLRATHRQLQLELAERQLGYRPGEPLNIGWMCSDRICQPREWRRSWRSLGRLSGQPKALHL